MPDTIEKHQDRLHAFRFDRGTGLVAGPQENKMEFYGGSYITTLLANAWEQPDLAEEQATCKAKVLFISNAYSGWSFYVTPRLIPETVITSKLDWLTVERKPDRDLPNWIYHLSGVPSHSRPTVSLDDPQAPVDFLTRIKALLYVKYANAFFEAAADRVVSKSDYSSFYLPSAENSADLIARVRAHLSLNTTELARTLLTERASIYNWMKGNNTPRPENRQRLTMLANFARTWTRLCHEPLQDLKHAIIEGDSTLIDLLSARDLNENQIKRALTQLAERRNAEIKAAKREKSIHEIAGERGWEPIDSAIREQSVRGLSLGRGR